MESGTVSLSFSQESPKFTYFDNFSWDQNTKYANNFEIIGNKITKILSDSEWHQVTSVQPLPKSITTSLTFKLQEYGKKGSYITMGIITENKKHFKDSDLDQTAFYVTSNKYKQGHMHLDNEQIQNKQQDLLILPGGELFMEVDLQKYQLTFDNKRRRVTHQLKQEHWKTNNIYVFVQIYEKNGSVSVLK